MILWKCNYGYCSTNDITNLNQITFTDFNSRFGIVTELSEFEKYNGPTADVDTAAVGVKYDDIILLQNALVSLLGEDYFKLYCAPYNIMKGDLSVARQAVPSCTLACPNLFEESFDQSYKYFCIYIPALKKIITRNGRVGSVNEDGTVSIISPNISSYYPPGKVNSIRCISPSMFLGYHLASPGYDGTKDSIINADNYYYIQWAGYPSNYKIVVNRTSSTGTYGKQIKEFYSALFLDFSPPDGNDPNPPDDPYEGGQISGPGTLPPGTFDDTSDPIPDSSLPTLSAANTGFTRIYNPTLAQVQQLAKYLWTEDTVVETIWNHIKQYFEDPMQAIIGFNLVPVPVPDGGIEEFALMYIGTGVNMTIAASQFVDVDCGTLTLDRYYGSALDQSPYTKIHCFLPYIGTVQLHTDEVMGTELQVKYRVDIVTGSCVAKIFVDGSCLYQYSGHCAINIPISSADFSSYVSSAISVAKMVGAGLAAAALGSSVGSSAPDIIPVSGPSQMPDLQVPSTSMAQVSTGGMASLQPYVPSVGPQASDFSVSSSTPPSFRGLNPQNIANTVAQVSGGKPYIQHSGSFSGNSGYLGIRRPYLIIERPNMCLPENYQALNGYPAMITMLLGDCQGYTRVQQVQLTGMWATETEQAEILQLLKSGVVF